MKIKEIDYYVAIYEMDQDGFPEYLAHFEDFYALNAFIRDNVNNPKYKNASLSYSFVENIDGEPDSFSWVQSFEFVEFSAEQMEHEVELFIEDEEENAEHWKKVDEFSKEIHFRGESADYTQKQQHLSDIVYVCPSCIRPVEECRCALYPYYLVQIDKLMVPIIRELNEKGYKTTGCCAGHPEQEEFVASGIYIAFAEEYDFDEPFPEGARYSKSRHTLQFIPDVNGYDNLVKFQEETLYKISDWAEMLFAVDKFDCLCEDQEDVDE